MDASSKLAMALDMYRTGERLMAARLRREHPRASAAEIEAMIRLWLQTRPGAVFGDAEGKPVQWPRPPRQTGC